MKSRTIEWLILILLFFVSIVTALITKCTYDEGDSIFHYFYSRFAISHKELFLDYWGKPLFITLSSPFAILGGFTGMKIFNVLIVFLSVLLTWLTAKKLELKYSWMIILLCYFSPKYFLIQFSGLTEPLFGLLMIAPVYFWLKGDKAISLIILSFIPYSRSEGMIICIVWIVYLMISGNFKKLPYIFTGTIVYAIIGYFVKNNLLWYFTDNIYATNGHDYGRGVWNHFINKYQEITGIVVYILFWIGWIYPLSKVVKIKNIFQNSTLLFVITIIYGSVAAYFVAHSYFWYNGIWGSFGLTRVLVVLVPYTSLIVLYGINTLSSLQKKEIINNITVSVLCLLIVSVPVLSKTENGFNFKKTLNPNHLQKVQEAATSWYKANLPKGKTIYTSAVYVNLLLNLDQFDTTQTYWAHGYGPFMKPGDYLFWDSWYGVVESDVKYETLISNKSLREVKCFDKSDIIDGDPNEKYRMCIFEKIE